MLQAGQQLSARFTVLRHLGTGGHGSVWLARDAQRPDEPVAVKVLHAGLARDPVWFAAWQASCERAGELRHPGVLRIDGVHRSSAHAWLAMEYAPGGDLTSLRGRPWVQVLSVLVPVADALAYAHARGVVHRDVKAANVLLAADGTPRLTDFAAPVPEPAAGAAIDPGRWPGSPYNTSPQQLDGAPATPADDVYAFGAMLYELLSGYPPLYPDITPARVRGERPASLATRCAAPAAVVQLVHRCLEKRVEDRPADMRAVRQALAAALEQEANGSGKDDRSGPGKGSGRIDEPTSMNVPESTEPPKIVPPTERGAGLRGEWRRTPVEQRSEETRRWQGFRRGLLVAATVFALGGLIFVFFALPRWVPPPQTVSQDSDSAAADAAAAPEPEEKVDLAALAQARLQAEQQRSDLDPRFVRLRERAAEEWGGEQFRAARNELSAGDERFAGRDYFAAVEHYSRAEPLISALEARMGEVVEERLAAGARALEAGDSAQAQAAFELVTRIEPDNKVAAQGLKRAQTLDEVRALIAQGERLEQDGDARAAADTYRKALALDAQSAPASEGLARANAQIAQDAFAGAMARGFAALSQGDYARAREAFQAANKLRPGAGEVTQALKQVEQEERTKTIAAKLATAGEHESAERWAAALAEYRGVLKLDETVAAAREGVQRVTPRAQLNEQLELYVTQPERLFSAPVRQAAREALARAAQVPNPGPLLQRQVATVSDWLARAETPVRVALQSDNLTQVTIHRVGALGAFQQRSLELAPGRYTVVGTRAGYRDVRREITVMPGESLPPIVIRCEEQI